MHYRADIQSGNTLSVLGFGCMRFPRNITGFDMKKTEDIILHAIDGGINYFDTAWAYPGNEEALGVILHRNQVREKIYIATKLPLVYVKGPADFDKYLNQSLERLKTTCIDYYLMHMITDMEQWAKLKAWGIEEWIIRRKKEGQIRQAGFSYHGNRDDFLKIIDDYDWNMCMIQYNYSDENYQAGVTGLKKAAQKMPVMIMEPLLGGKLATGLPKKAIEIYQNAHQDISPAGWGLNWVWNQKEVTTVLSGMSTMAQLEENLHLAGLAQPGMLRETEMEIYRQVLEVINRAYRVRCTGCNYCMPCPRGINIPGSLAAYNSSYSQGFFEGLKQFIFSTGMISEHSASPSLCIKCGKCEPLCPQNLPIIRHLKQVDRRLNPFWMKFAGICARAYLGKKRTINNY